MCGERGLRDHLSWRITNGSDTCSKIFHQQTVSWGDREAQNRAVFAAIGRISSPVGELLLGPLPLAAEGGRAGGAGSLLAVTQRVAVALRPAPDTHFGAAPARAPPRASPA